MFTRQHKSVHPQHPYVPAETKGGNSASTLFLPFLRFSVASQKNSSKRLCKALTYKGISQTKSKGKFSSTYYHHLKRITSAQLRLYLPAGLGDYRRQTIYITRKSKKYFSTEQRPRVCIAERLKAT